MMKIKLTDRTREITLYLVFGALTTLVNILSYFLLVDILKIYYLAANLAAWFASVLFAYVTNRLYVFSSAAKGIPGIAKEALLFFGCRAFSGAADMLVMYCLVDVLSAADTLAKVITGAIVVVLNYIFSKALVFRKKALK
jgi:putative flippase GtrA